MDVEKSDEGIVVTKYARKTAQANEWMRVIHAGNDSKDSDLCEAWNRKWYSLIDKIWAKPNLAEAFKLEEVFSIITKMSEK